MTSTKIQFWTRKNLNNKEAGTIINKGDVLFGLMTLTPDAEKYLEFNKDLKEAIAKW